MVYNGETEGSDTNMIIGIADNCGVSVVKESDSELCGKRIVYRLYQVKFEDTVRYVVFVEYENEAEVCFAGADRKCAEELFGIVCANDVTPCSLCDIAEDFSKK